jgi:hypothetical protein
MTPMTEPDWNSCTEPQAMLEWLHQQGKLTDRKARLFSVAVCRRIWPQLTDERSRNAVKLAEPAADEPALLKRLDAVSGEAEEVFEDTFDDAAFTASYASSPDLGFSVIIDAMTAAADAAPAGTPLEMSAQAELLRDFFRPFRESESTDTSCLTPAVLSLAQRAYDDRLLPSGHLKSDNLAALAAALEAAGCQDAELLSHLLDAGPHCRGCHAVDAVLGRE